MTRLLWLLSLFLLIGCENAAAPPSAPTTVQQAAATHSSQAPTATTATSVALPPADSDAIAVPASNGRPGFRFGGLSGHGWSRSGPDGEVIVHLSGPPGGPLGFEVRTYHDGVSDQSTLRKLFEDTGVRAPITEGKSEAISLAGKTRSAQAFRTGSSLATSNTCVVKIPAGEGARIGLLVLATLGSNEKTEPSCAHSLSHGPIKAIVESFELQ